MHRQCQFSYLNPEEKLTIHKNANVAKPRLYVLCVQLSFPKPREGIKSHLFTNALAGSKSVLFIEKSSQHDVIPAVEFESNLCLGWRMLGRPCLTLRRISPDGCREGSLGIAKSTRWWWRKRTRTANGPPSPPTSYQWRINISCSAVSAVPPLPPDLVVLGLLVLLSEEAADHLDQVFLLILWKASGGSGGSGSARTVHHHDVQPGAVVPPATPALARDTDEGLLLKRHRLSEHRHSCLLHDPKRKLVNKILTNPVGHEFGGTCEPFPAWATRETGARFHCYPRSLSSWGPLQCQDLLALWQPP